MHKAKWITAMVIAALILILMAQNTQVVTVRLFLWEISMSRIIFFPALVLLGFVLGYMAALFQRRS